MHNVLKKSVVLMFGLGLLTAAQAAEHQITVEVDGGMYGEMEVIAGWIDANEAGVLASREWLISSNSIAAKIEQLAHARMDDDGFMSLDDGTNVLLVEGDIVSIGAQSGASRNRAEVRLVVCMDAGGLTWTVPLELGNGQEKVTIPKGERASGNDTRNLQVYEACQS